MSVLQTGGYGNYQVSNIAGEIFTLDNPVGTFSLSGTVDQFNFTMSTGKLDARQLSARQIYAQIQSFGRAQVNAPELLDTTLDGSG